MKVKVNNKTVRENMEQEEENEETTTTTRNKKRTTTSQAAKCEAVNNLPFACRPARVHCVALPSDEDNNDARGENFKCNKHAWCRCIYRANSSTTYDKMIKYIITTRTLFKHQEQLARRRQRQRRRGRRRRKWSLGIQLTRMKRIASLECSWSIALVWILPIFLCFLGASTSTSIPSVHSIDASSAANASTNETFNAPSATIIADMNANLQTTTTNQSKSPSNEQSDESDEVDAEVRIATDERQLFEQGQLDDSTRTSFMKLKQNLSSNWPNFKLTFSTKNHSSNSLEGKRQRDHMTTYYQKPWQYDSKLLSVIMHNKTVIFVGRQYNYFFYWQFAQTAASSVIFVMIVVGNISILYRLKSCRRSRSNVNYFIVHLAIADLMVGFFSTTLDSVFRIQGIFTYGLWACRASKYVAQLFIYASTYLLVALSIDRWEAVVKPLAFTKNRNRGYYLAGTAWALSFISPSPVLFNTQVIQVQGLTQCWISYDQKQWKVYMLYLTGSLLLLPTFIIAICYVHIVYTIWSKGKQGERVRRQRRALELQKQQEHKHSGGRGSESEVNNNNNNNKQHLSSTNHRAQSGQDKQTTQPSLSAALPLGSSEEEGSSVELHSEELERDSLDGSTDEDEVELVERQLHLSSGGHLHKQQHQIDEEERGYGEGEQKDGLSKTLDTTGLNMSSSEQTDGNLVLLGEAGGGVLVSSMSTSHGDRKREACSGEGANLREGTFVQPQQLTNHSVNSNPNSNQSSGRRELAASGGSKKEEKQGAHLHAPTQQHGIGVIPKARIKTIKMTLVIVAAFVLCWSPFYIINLLIVFGVLEKGSSDVSVALSTLSQTLAHLNSAVNPIIFWLFSSRRNNSTPATSSADARNNSNRQAMSHHWSKRSLWSRIKQLFFCFLCSSNSHNPSEPKPQQTVSSLEMIKAN